MYIRGIERVKNARNTQEYWERINFFRRVKKRKTGAISLESWVSYYNNIYPLRPPNDLILGEVFVEDLDSPFTMEELEFALKSAKLKKAAGDDGIPVEYYTNLTEDWKLFLLRVFN